MRISFVATRQNTVFFCRKLLKYALWAKKMAASAMRADSTLCPTLMNTPPDHWGCLSHRIVRSVGSGRCWFVYDWSNLLSDHWYSSNWNVEEQKNGVLRSSVDLITQKWCPSQRLPAVQWRWWCNRFNALIYTGYHHSSQSLLQFNRGQSWATCEEGNASHEHCNDFWDRPHPGQGYCAQ